MKDATYIAVLLDRSGSMSSVKDDTIGGFNQFIKDQKEAGDNAMLTLVQFDSGGIDTVHESLAIKDVPDLSDETFQPRGSTPLLDAMGKTIETTGKALEAIPQSDRPDKVVFVVITDGQENASREFTKARIKEMVSHQSDVYKWNFLYLGANQDAFAEAHSMGIPQAQAAAFVGVAMDSVFAANSSNVANYRRTGQRSNLAYSGGQRARMLKKDDPKRKRA